MLLTTSDYLRILLKMMNGYMNLPNFGINDFVGSKIHSFVFACGFRRRQIRHFKLKNRFKTFTIKKKVIFNPL